MPSNPSPHFDDLPQGLVFNIQRYAIHDGPGIRTTVFLMSCPLKCFWCQNPESQQRQPVVFLSKDNCTLCGLCVEACPSGASILGEESATIDRRICSGCGMCTEVCLNEARRLVGNYITVDEIMHEVLRDRKFYENSGGGVTISGGEPTTQPDFALAILQHCKRERLHTALDTCGHAPWPILEKLLEYADLVLYDIKHMDSAKHQEATGVPNDLILENAKRIAAYKAMKVRVPLVPGFNDSSENIRATAQFAKSELGSEDIDLLPYNKLAESKYTRLEMDYIRLEGLNEEKMKELEVIIGKS